MCDVRDVRVGIMRVREMVLHYECDRLHYASTRGGPSTPYLLVTCDLLHCTCSVPLLEMASYLMCCLLLLRASRAK